MPAITATAPGKIILLGEHAVVYGRPAIAVPVEGVRARAVVSANPRGQPGQVHIQAPDIYLDAELHDLPRDHPIRSTLTGIFSTLGIPQPLAFNLRVTSTIPLAAGLGSGAAVSVAIIRAVSAFFGRPLPDEQVSRLAYEIEKLHHGTPSGIDNTVITYARPVYYQRSPEGEPHLETFRVERPFTIVIADTGLRSPTSIPVAEVRRLWQGDPGTTEILFDEIGRLVVEARRMIESGEAAGLGLLMDQNHALLCKLGVSSPELDRLVGAARSAGAFGAKLSGGGRGGNMIALAPEDKADAVARSLMEAGATRTMVTVVRDRQEKLSDHP
jgi:mevalonate kinase